LAEDLREVFAWVALFPHPANVWAAVMATASTIDGSGVGTIKGR
jgi:hypothetical protein